MQCVRMKVWQLCAFCGFGIFWLMSVAAFRWIRFGRHSPWSAAQRLQAIDEIDDYTWTMFSDDLNDGCETRQLDNIMTLFDFLQGNSSIPCKDMREIGGAPHISGIRDGQKMVCFDPELKLLEGRCIVLSFGINHEWSFDENMERLGCEVYAFDPSMGELDHNRTKNIHFYNLGVAGSKREVYFKDSPAKLDSYYNILKMLGLLEEPIDYLKIDIEGFEFETLEVIIMKHPDLLKRIRQIAVEFHPLAYHGSGVDMLHTRFDRLWRIKQRLECRGFVLRSSEMNHSPNNLYRYKRRQVAACYELLWTRYPD